MIIAATIAVSVGIGACVAFGYVAVRRELLANMDAQLARQAAGFAVMAKYQNKPKPSTGKGKSGNNSPAAERAYAIAYGHRFGDAVGISQFVASNGKTVPAQSPTVMSQGNLSTIPLIPDDLKVAAGESPDGFRTIQLNGGAARVYTMHIAGTREAVMVALPLSGIDTELKQLRNRTRPRRPGRHRARRGPRLVGHPHGAPPRRAADRRRRVHRQGTQGTDPPHRPRQALRQG